MTAKAVRKQCLKCPWKVGTDPLQIPGGYCQINHANLKNTIARPSDISQLNAPLRMMACHETNTRDKELPCVGWLANQLGPGNNIALRLRALSDRSLTDFRLVGEQHKCLEDTLPK